MSELIPIYKEKPTRRHPDWVKMRLPTGEKFKTLQRLLKTNRLHTICEEARCPNIGECWSHGTATFLILGDVCTRWCGYCSVKTGKPHQYDEEEPAKVADSVRQLELQYVVITSVTRDDLEDGGAELYAQTVRSIHEQMPDCSVELLIPDFKIRTQAKLSSGTLNVKALKTVIESKPEVVGHNIEAVRRVFKRVRPGGNYDVSLELLKKVKEIDPTMHTKSSIILGFDETKEEIIQTMKDLREAEVDFLSLGQYLRPSLKHVEITKYYHPSEFSELAEIGKELGFKHVEAGPLVRSSYRADKLNKVIKSHEKN